MCTTENLCRTSDNDSDSSTKMANPCLRHAVEKEQHLVHVCSLPKLACTCEIKKAWISEQCQQ